MKPVWYLLLILAALTVAITEADADPPRASGPDTTELHSGLAPQLKNLPADKVLQAPSWRSKDGTEHGVAAIWWWTQPDHVHRFLLDGSILDRPRTCRSMEGWIEFRDFCLSTVEDRGLRSRNCRKHMSWRLIKGRWSGIAARMRCMNQRYHAR